MKDYKKNDPRFWFVHNTYSLIIIRILLIVIVAYSILKKLGLIG